MSVPRAELDRGSLADGSDFWFLAQPPHDVSKADWYVLRHASSLILMTVFQLQLGLSYS